MRAALWRATRTLRVSRAAHQPLSCVCAASKQQRRYLHHTQMAGPRGAFIVLEGTDRSGKSTQCARLVTALNAAGVPAELWRFPDRTTSVGQMLDAYLRGTPEGDADDAAVHLLFSANRWEKRCVGGGGGVCAKSESLDTAHLPALTKGLACWRRCRRARRWWWTATRTAAWRSPPPSGCRGLGWTGARYGRESCCFTSVTARHVLTPPRVRPGTTGTRCGPAGAGRGAAAPAEHGGGCAEGGVWEGALRKGGVPGPGASGDVAMLMICHCGTLTARWMRAPAGGTPV